jgi:tetratricopeptide (TPR) repeat protein
LNCPYCGADTKNAVTICPLCGKTLDRDSAYRSFMKKGDDFLAADDAGKAALSYKKALEYTAGTEEIYLKLGSAYNKMNDKQAAGMYMKALSFNFYNGQTHNYLISLYSRYGKLDDLRRWYGQSREKADRDFIDKYIKIIDNVKYFSTQAAIRIPKSKPDGLTDSMISGMKRYMMMNIIGGILIVVVGIAVVAGIFLKMNTSFLIMFAGFFLGVSVIIMFYMSAKAKKKKDRGTKSLEEFMKEENKF